MIRKKIAVFWFRRDLRLTDNTALAKALESGSPVLPLFIFDKQIIEELAIDDARVSFIYQELKKIHQLLSSLNSSLHVFKGEPLTIWKDLVSKYEIEAVYVNKDYEPYARKRDDELDEFLGSLGIPMYRFKDQVIFEEAEIVKKDGKPYTVFTPYKKKWLERFHVGASLKLNGKLESGFFESSEAFPRIEALGFFSSNLRVLPYDLSRIGDYPLLRDLPAPDATSYLSPHLRFGTIGIRTLIATLDATDEIFLSELIWREFFMQILFHFPHVVSQNFKS